MAQPAQKLTPRDKRRRRQRALFSIFGYIVVAIGLSWFFESQATTTILFVRHAEAELANGDEDPGLSSAGLVRAEALADFVQDIDVIAGVDAIYASEFKRTQETAAAVARRLELEVAIADPYEVEDFIRESFRQRFVMEHGGAVLLRVSYHAPVIRDYRRIDTQKLRGRHYGLCHAPRSQNDLDTGVIKATMANLRNVPEGKKISENSCNST